MIRLNKTGRYDKIKIEETIQRGKIMDVRILLDMLHIAERLKDTTRHCDTSKGRRESVAEHSWRLALMAYWMKDEFPDADMNKVISMCLIHDLGEAFTGDIPVFDKTESDENLEEELLFRWLETLPGNVKKEMKALFDEMNERKTVEAKIFKAIDGLEAVIQHNESDISSWENHEYDLQLTYCNDRVEFSPYLKKLREEIRIDTLNKIEKAKQ